MDDNKYPPEGAHRLHLSFERQLPVGAHVYQLTASSTGDERIGLALVGWNASGEVVSELSGGISPADLAPVAEALTSTLTGLAALRRQRLDPAVEPGSAPAAAGAPGWAAAVSLGSAPAAAGAPGSAPVVLPGSAVGVAPASAAPAPVKRHQHQGTRWSAEDDDRLAMRHRAGATRKELMAEFGRSRGGITARLERLGLIAPDGVPVARPGSAAPARDPAGPVQEGDPVAGEAGVIAEAA